MEKTYLRTYREILGVNMKSYTTKAVQLSFILLLAGLSFEAGEVNAESRELITPEKSSAIIDTFSDLSEEEKARLKAHTQTMIENPNLKYMMYDAERTKKHIEENQNNNKDAQQRYHEILQDPEMKQMAKKLKREEAKAKKRQLRGTKQYEPIGKYWE